MLIRRLAALIICAALCGAARVPRPGSKWDDMGVNDEATPQPIIGVLTQSPMRGDTFCPTDGSYIAASYIKFLESGGARVVPILQDMPREAAKELFSKINGFLIPGGAAILRPGHFFFDTASLFFDMAVKASDRGDAFPLMGICLGMETLAVIVAGEKILTPFDSEGTAATLLFTPDAPDSRFFSSWDLDLAVDVLKQNLTRESHTRGVNFKHYEAHTSLRDFYSVLSLSTDREGKVYISTMEARDYPITALQWHPEKNAFENSGRNIPHGVMAVEVMHQTSRYFVNQTRYNRHAFADRVDADIWLINNDERVFSGKHRTPDESLWADEVFVFPAWEHYQHRLVERAQGTTREAEYRRRFGGDGAMAA